MAPSFMVELRLLPNLYARRLTTARRGNGLRSIIGLNLEHLALGLDLVPNWHLGPPNQDVSKTYAWRDYGQPRWRMGGC